jgi:outer membrane receptor protein involved in Fe transport
MKQPLLTLFLTVCLCLNAVETNETVYELSDFVVTDKNDKGYFSGSSTSATKANELIKNTPVNVTVLNQELLDDLGINTTEDLAQVSAAIDTDPTSYSLDQIRIRGFRNSFTRFNGFRRTLPRDGYNISRYDIIKGANSMIFGQASPGGTVNAIPLLANFRKDAGAIAYSFGNKNLSKKIFNYNKVLSDKLAFRMMLINNYKGYEHAYKNYDLKSRTLAINYRPNSTSSLQLHLEKVDSKFSFPTLSMKDATMIDDSVDHGSTEDRSPYDGYLSSSESRSMKHNFNVPFNAEWLDFAEDKMLFNLFWHTRNNGNPSALSNDSFLNNTYYPFYIAPGIDPPEEASGGDLLGTEELQETYASSEYTNFSESEIATIASEVRNYLRNYYSIINEHNYGYQSGPDKNKKITGVFNTLDYQKVLGNGLEFSLSANYQSQEGKNIARDSYGVSRVLDSYSDPSKNWPKPTTHLFYNDVPASSFEDPDSENNYYTDGTLTNYEAALSGIQPEPFIRTYWTKTEGDNSRKGLKGTLLYEKEHTLPIVGKVENKYLMGWDVIDINKSELRYDQIPDYGGNNSEVTNELNPLNPDGSYLNPDIDDLRVRAQWITNSKITDREKAFEYIRLFEGFGSDRSIMRFNNIIENDFVVRDTGGNYQSIIDTGYVRDDADPDANSFGGNNILFNENEGQREQLAKWQESARLSAAINTNSQWLATQSSLYNGRLRTLIGVRFDKISIETSFRKTSLFGDGSDEIYVIGSNNEKIYLTADQINQKQSEQYTKASPTLGALYWLNNKVGIFTNYAQSIESPTGQERTPLGTLPDPEIGKGLEFGMRYSTPDNSFDAQLAYYAIEKENDNEFKYSNLGLLEIYPYDEIIGIADDLETLDVNETVIGSNPELIYIYNTNGNSPRLNEATMPGRRTDGDVTLSKGIELDINYNPTRNVNFIASINHNIDNKILKVNPRVQTWLDENGYDRNELYFLPGRPDFRGSITGKYSFKSGKLKGLSLGLSQHYRSGSNIGKYYFYFDANGNLLNINEIKGTDNVFNAADEEKIDRTKTQEYYLKSKAEHNTIAFINYNNFFRSNGKRYKYSINFRVNNLFDISQFINRSNYGTYRESRTYNITTKIHF